MNEYHLYVTNKYFELLLKMWALILFEIDYNILFKLQQEIDMWDITQQTINDLKDLYIDENILIICIKIKYIFKVLDLYMINNFNLYTFFNLSNQIKINIDSKYNLNQIKQLDLFFPNINIPKNIFNSSNINDINNTLTIINQIKVKLGYPNISEMYNKFYEMKQKVFENEFDLFFKNNFM